jgi:hypothetical protein
LRSRRNFNHSIIFNKLKKNQYKITTLETVYLDCITQNGFVTIEVSTADKKEGFKTANV